MLRNLIVIAIRNLKKYPGYSLLNIFGLMIGITFSLLLIFYIRDELSYDRYHAKADRIYRINSYVHEPGKEELNWAITQFPLGPTLQTKFPEVEEAVRFVAAGPIQFKTGNLRIFENKIYYTDSSYFKIFTQKIIEGDPATALQLPKSLVITEAVAKKYFGTSKGVVGKALTNPSNDVFTVRAVIEDVPVNSHFLFNVLISVSSLPAQYSNDWGNFGFYTYVLLKPGVSKATFEKKLGGMYDEYMASIFKQFNVKIHYGIQPLTDIHLNSGFQNEPEQTGSMSYIYIFSAVVVFMLLIACINYMNLATARSARRSKEIGVRKVSGSSKSQLIMQFLVESTVITAIALILSIGLIFAFLPSFNLISGKQIGYSMLFKPDTFIIILILIIVVGLVGGSYPAFYLSRMQPVAILKGAVSKSGSNVTLRKVLVVTQFTIALIMLICTWVVDRQLAYLRSRDLGFNQEQVLSLKINTNQDVRSTIGSFKDELRKIPSVRSVSSSDANPGSPVGINLFSIDTKNGFIDQGIEYYGVDENYFSTLGIKVVRGRGFTSRADTARSIIINEKFAKQFGWDEPISKKVRVSGDTSDFYYEVVGVVKDFHQRSLYNAITPLVLLYRPAGYTVQVKMAPGKIDQTIASVKKLWSAIFPDLEFSYTFLDEDLNSQYDADQRRAKIYTSFSLLTIVITCLGLLGLIAFITEQRQKEISIRKILGAGLPQLVPMITKNFVLLVGISCLIAFPVAFIFMAKWLQVFPYNSGMSVWPFVYSAITVLLITVATVMFHTVKAAVANPTKSLRSE